MYRGVLVVPLAVWVVTVVIAVDAWREEPCDLCVDKNPNCDQIPYICEEPMWGGKKKCLKYCNVCPPPTSCPCGWTQFGPACYQLRRQRVPYTQAAANCAAGGAALAASRTEAENDFLKGLIGQVHPIWLYATDEAQEGVWVWQATRDDVTWADWDTASGQPSGGTSKNCVYLSGARHLRHSWRAACCSSWGFTCRPRGVMRYVCVRPALGAPLKTGSPEVSRSV